MKFKVLYKDLVVLELEMYVGARFRKEINTSFLSFQSIDYQSSRNSSKSTEYKN